MSTVIDTLAIAEKITIAQARKNEYFSLMV